MTRDRADALERQSMQFSQDIESFKTEAQVSLQKLEEVRSFSLTMMPS